jgi:hypothetical protein
MFWARLEFFGGLAIVALMCVLAGFAVVSEIISTHPSREVRECVARAAAVAVAHHKPVSEKFLIEMCERLKPPKRLIKLK